MRITLLVGASSLSGISPQSLLTRHAIGLLSAQEATGATELAEEHAQR